MCDIVIDSTLYTSVKVTYLNQIPHTNHMEPSKQRPISRGFSSTGNASCSIEIKNLTREEHDWVDAMLLGGRWIKVGQDGRLESRLPFEPLPDPVADPLMQPFWQAASFSASGANLQPELIEKPFAVELHSIPGIIIGHVCGYYYTPEKYQSECAKLKEYGFIQMRSQRGQDSRYTEHWYLASEWHAEGALKDFIQGLRTKKKSISAQELTREIVHFLCQKCLFGTLDILTQRAAMPIPE